MAGQLVTLTEARRQLNATDYDTADDAELLDVIATATEIVEDICGPVVPRTVTQRIAGPTYYLDQVPVLSLVSYTPDAGAPFDLSSYAIDPSGVISPLILSVAGSVVYRAGRDPIPATLKTAALIMVQHLWDTQRAGAITGALGSGGEVVNMGAGYLIPNRAAGLMARHRRPSAIA